MRYKLSDSKTGVLLACLTAYALALSGALITGFYFSGSEPLLVAAIADIVATIIVFAFAMIFDNSSIYDPYWSLAPVALAFYWAFNIASITVVPARQFALLFLLIIWALRLTFNCFQRWQNLKQEDWRYAEMRPKAGRFYWPVSFLGFHLFPTIIVFAGCLSLYTALFDGKNQFGVLDVAAITVTGLAIWIEAEADRDLKIFRANRQNAGHNIESGLWAYSRHPNYFGEVLFWWGLYLFALAANPEYWWVILGPVLITALFIFVSVPMMDRHILDKRKSYSENIQKISAFVPWFRRG